MLTATTARSLPTLEGVAETQQKIVAVLNELRRRVGTVGDHLCGCEPVDPSGGQAPLPPCGAVESMERVLSEAVAIVEEIGHQLNRIESVVGTPPDRLAKVPENYKGLSEGRGQIGERAMGRGGELGR